jgi:MFS family permease
MLGLPRTYWYLWTGALINRLGGFVFPFLALYLTQARHLTVAEAGLVVSLYGLGSIGSGPVGGVLADRLGRRATLLLGFVVSATAMLQLGVARAPAHIAASTLLLGFCADLYRPALQATVADVVPPEARTRAYGYLYWAVNLGFSGAVMIAGLLASQSYLLLFVGDAATTLCFGVVVFLRVPETHPERDAAVRRPVSLLQPYRDGVLMSFIATQCLVLIVFLQFLSTLPLDMSAHGVSAKMYGSLAAINGVLICILQPTAIRLVQRFARGRVLAVSALLTGVAAGAAGFAHTPSQYALVLALWTLGELGFSPVAPTLVADLSPVELRGSYQGVSNMTFGAASCLAPALGSVVLGRFGPPALWGSCFGLSLVAAALHLTIAPRRRRRMQELAGADGARREDGIARVA